MIKLSNMDKIVEMGFVKSGVDYLYKGKNDLGTTTLLFTIYKGSPYLRFSKTAYVCESQLECICKWSKLGLIEWEEEK